MRRGKPHTWGCADAAASKAAFPGPAHLGLATWGHVGQSAVLWKARCLPRVGAAFEAAWGLDGGAPLIVSFDGLTVFRPPQLAKVWTTQPALKWLHCDQGATKVRATAPQRQAR
jgi:hypothetical protein